MRYVALLRAVNVGGRSIPMAELRAMCAELGLTDVATLLQSGNLVLSSPLGAANLTALLERETAQRFGTPVPYVVRTAPQWHALIAANPFPVEAERDPSHLVAIPCTSAVETSAVAALQAWIAGREVVRAVGSDLYVTYPDGQGESRLTLTAIEKRLAIRGTARNWNTVRKIAALL